MAETKQYEVLKRASLFLEKHHRESKVAELLLIHHLNVPRSKFFMNMQEPVPKEVQDAFYKDICQHAETGIPVQHMIGYEEFYGRRFSVDKHVLIPRPETEELVWHVIDHVKKINSRPVQIVDVGTGSGVIAITLALEIDDAEVIATDISNEALQIAEKNNKNLNAQVHFMQGNFLASLIDNNMQADIIVSNPPYIAEAERDELSDTVKNFDPDLALFADHDGLAAYEEIVAQAKSVLKTGGILAFEIGHTQGEAVKMLIKESFPQAAVDILQDMNGKDRIVLGKLAD